jgi:hypothetical protein
MASNAAADSGAFFRVAANTSDHRVCGNIRGASLDEIKLLMEIMYPMRITGNRVVVTEEVRKSCPAQTRFWQSP